MNMADVNAALGTKADKATRESIHTAIGTYLEKLDFTDRQPGKRGAERELKRVRNAAGKAQEALHDLDAILDSLSETSLYAVRTAASGEVVFQIKEMLPVLGNLTAAAYSFEVSLGGQEELWEREDFITDLARIFAETTGRSPTLLIHEHVGYGKFFDFVLACSEGLPGFDGEDMTSITKVIRRSIKPQRK